VRASRRNPRLSWFQCYPEDFIADEKFLAMGATARGVYWSLQLYGWVAFTHGDGLCADAGFLQRISGTTPLEWDAVKDQVLSLFELHADGKLYLPWLCEAAEDAAEKVRKLKHASAEKAKKNAPEIKTDETDETRLDEIRLDKNGRSNERPSERPFGHPIGPSPAASADGIGSSSVPPSTASGASFAQRPGSSSPSSLSVEPDEVREGQNAGNEKSANPDVMRVREHAHNHGWKLPNVADVERLLESYSAEEVCDGMEDYDENLNTADDRHYAEYRFFGEGGASSVISAMRHRIAEEQAKVRR